MLNSIEANIFTIRINDLESTQILMKRRKLRFIRHSYSQHCPIMFCVVTKLNIIIRLCASFGAPSTVWGFSMLCSSQRSLKRGNFIKRIIKSARMWKWNVEKFTWSVAQKVLREGWATQLRVERWLFAVLQQLAVCSLNYFPFPFFLYR